MAPISETEILILNGRSDQVAYGILLDTVNLRNTRQSQSNCFHFLKCKQNWSVQRYAESQQIIVFAHIEDESSDHFVSFEREEGQAGRRQNAFKLSRLKSFKRTSTIEGNEQGKT